MRKTEGSVSRLRVGWPAAVVGILLCSLSALSAISEAQAQGPPTPSALAPRVDFGVIVSSAQSNQDVEYLLGQLGLKWWYNFDVADSSVDPQSVNRVRLLRTGSQALLQPATSLTALAHAHPGRAWMIGNEPNVGGQDNTPPATYAHVFHDTSAALRAGDPSAVIVGPNVLNWEFTCVACPGDMSGRTWVDDFRFAYRTAYGVEPPVDVWGVHAYDIDWQSLPMVRVDRTEHDFHLLRDYLQSVPEYADKPIWITEFGVIWGFEGISSLKVDGADRLQPTGTYQVEQVDASLAEFVGWLKSQGPSLGIGRAFLYATHPPAEPYATQVAGITLFDAIGNGAGLTSSGLAYRDAIHLN